MSFQKKYIYLMCLYVFLQPSVLAMNRITGVKVPTISLIAPSLWTFKVFNFGITPVDQSTQMPQAKVTFAQREFLSKELMQERQSSVQSVWSSKKFAGAAGAQSGMFKGTISRFMSRQEAANILGISSINASQEEIKSAYLKAVLKAHPDTGGSSEKFRNVKEACQILTGKANAPEYEGNASNDYSSNNDYSRHSSESWKTYKKMARIGISMMFSYLIKQEYLIYLRVKQEDLNRDLARSIRDGEVERAQNLLQQGADPNIQFVKHGDEYLSKTNLLIFAIELDKPEMVKMLLDAGANPCVGTGRGFSALDYAYACRNLVIKEEIIKILTTSEKRLRKSEPYKVQYM
jgi:hypothetical protein